MEKINTYVSLTDLEIENLWEQICNLHEIYLKKFNIILPKKNSNKMYQLIYLYYYQGKAISKEVISKFVQEHNPKASGDQQVRHLSAQHGYYVLGKNGIYKNESMPLGYYLLVNLTEPDPNWNNNQTKRNIILSTDDFDLLKINFNNCCATCGVKENSIHPRTGKKVILQKGHINPSKPLEIGNIIPQCEYCNQNIYKNDFVFTSFGYPESIYNPKYILKSDENIQREMYNILKEKFKEKEK